MKHFYHNLLSLLVCLLGTGIMATSCSSDKDEKKDDPGTGPGASTNIVVTNLVATFNSVSFHVEAKDAQSIAYLVDKRGATPTAAQVFTKGEPVKSDKADGVVKGLIGSTEYTLFVVSSTASGLSEVYSQDFATTQDTGAPATTLSAGLRVDEDNITQNNVKIRVANGADINYSYVLVMPTVYMENLIMDVAQNDETGYLKSLCTETAYGGQMKIEGANTEKIIDYNSDMEASLLPDADYSAISVGITAEGETETLGDLTRIDFHTAAFPLIGDPEVKIEIPDGQAKYIAIRYKYTPNADADYFCRFATDKNQVDKFLDYFDAKYGAGQGQEKLRQFVRFVDQSYAEHTEGFEETLKYGFMDTDHILTMLGIGLDKNLMPGTKLSRADDHLNPIPDADKGEYTLTVSEVGAHFAQVDAHLGKNCGAVFFRMVEGDGSGYNTHDVDLALALYDEGWGMGPKTDQTIEDDFSEFYHADINPNTQYVMISTSLNYFGGLDTVRISKPFTTKSFNKYAGTDLLVTINHLKSTKSTATLHYAMADKARLLHHRVLATTRWDEVDSEKPETKTEQQIIDFITSARYGEMWSAEDLAEPDPRNWDWQWTGMEPNTSYTYYYVTEDSDGNLSKLGSLEFKTNASAGGAAPKVEFSVTDIRANSCVFSITAVQDVSSFIYLFVGDDANFYTNMGEEERKKELYNELKTSGINSVDDIVNRTVDNLVAGIQYYAVAMPFGAEGKEGEMTIIPFKTATTRSAAQLSDARTVKVKSSTPLLKNSIHQMGSKAKSAAPKIKRALMKGKRPSMIVPPSKDEKQYPTYQFFDMKKAPLLWKK